MKKKNKTKSKKDDAETTKQSRIAVVQSDPVFHEMPKREKKVKVDSRFKGMFDDEEFASTAAKVDRHGRPINKLKNREDLRNIYELDESEPSDPQKQLEKPNSVTSKSKKIDFARGEGDFLSSSSEDSSDDESVNNEEDEANIHDRWGELDHDARKVDWTSCRIAVCNLDWDKMTAEDIYVALTSFKPEDGVIKSVHVYLSDFGAQQLQYEEKHGPKLKDGKVKEAKTDERMKDNNNEEASAEAIRAYQFDRFRFYYAVVECDSDETANAIYEGCDGVQYQSTGLALDLRFIPDDMKFDKSRLRDQCLPDNVNLRKYKPNFFQSDVTYSNVKLNWDGSDYRRQRKVEMAFNEDADLDELNELIASGSEDEGSDIDETKKLLLSAASIDVKKKKTKEEHQLDEPTISDMEKQPKAAKIKSKHKLKMVVKKKRRLAELATNLPVDLNDSRFTALYTSSDFAIDKTDSHYKGGVLADRQVEEKLRRNK